MCVYHVLLNLIRHIPFNMIKRRARRNGFICLFIPFCFALTVVYNISLMFDIHILSSNQQQQQQQLKQKLILIYTPFFDDLPWPDIPYHYNFTKADGTSCAVDLCELTYNKSRLGESDAVIFHGRDLPYPEDLILLREKVNRTEQHWIWFMLESPMNLMYEPDTYDGIFNWSITYNYDSDGVVPYYTMRSLRPGEARPRKGTDFTRGKDKMVLYFNSNCLSLRMSFVEELKKYVEMDVFGDCKTYFNPELPDCPRNSTRCRRLQRRYKFYLAFENSYCEDYVTEKLYHHGYERRLIPIVMGGANYSKSRIAFHKSVINVQHFESVELLAEYINYLDRNDTAYNEYFNWTYEYTVEGREPMCVACKALWEKNPEERKLLELSTFWDRQTKCIEYEQILPYYF